MPGENQIRWAFFQEVDIQPIKRGQESGITWRVASMTPRRMIDVKKAIDNISTTELGMAAAGRRKREDHV